jgi:transposase InsO family protein
VAHYHEERIHQGKQNRLLFPLPNRGVSGDNGIVRCKERLGGLLKYYEREAATELIFHSDRGSQYASYDFTRVLRECGITPSMSRKGNCWDNACSETLFGSLKVERLHGKHFETLRQAQDEALDWLLWYNQTRRHSTLNYVSPTQFEQNWNRSTAAIAS